MLEQLIGRRTSLALQRAQAKDVVEATERQLQIVQGQIGVLEEYIKQQEEAEAKALAETSTAETPPGADEHGSISDLAGSGGVRDEADNEEPTTRSLDTIDVGRRIKAANDGMGIGPADHNTRTITD